MLSQAAHRVTGFFTSRTTMTKALLHLDSSSHWSQGLKNLPDHGRSKLVFNSFNRYTVSDYEQLMAEGYGTRIFRHCIG